VWLGQGDKINEIKKNKANKAKLVKRLNLKWPKARSHSRKVGGYAGETESRRRRKD
jgi:hypothetical protein